MSAPIQHATPTHKALADLLDMLNSLPGQVTVTIPTGGAAVSPSGNVSSVRAGARGQSLAAQVRNAILSGSGGIGPQ